MSFIVFGLLTLVHAGPMTVTSTEPAVVQILEADLDESWAYCPLLEIQAPPGKIRRRCSLRLDDSPVAHAHVVAITSAERDVTFKLYRPARTLRTDLDRLTDYDVLITMPPDRFINGLPKDRPLRARFTHVGRRLQ